MGDAVYSDYHPTINIHISSAYVNWKQWIRAWARQQDKLTRLMMLAVSGFRDPSPYALAEIAFFAAESSLFARIDQGAIVLVRKAGLLRDANPNFDNTLPSEHILIHICDDAMPEDKH